MFGNVPSYVEFVARSGSMGASSLQPCSKPSEFAEASFHSYFLKMFKFCYSITLGKITVIVLLWAWGDCSTKQCILTTGSRLSSNFSQRSVVKFSRTSKEPMHSHNVLDIWHAG